MGLIEQRMNNRAKTIRMALEGVVELNSSGTS